ncbi:MAG: transporter [Deltaproteobacteria bacterium]|nr:transporter [Deltaproteobacteria bacterium]
MSKRSFAWLAAFSLTLGLSQTAFAGGFAVLEQSVEGLGQAFAGKSAGYGDGSSVYFNPAAMAAHKGSRATIAVHGIIPKAEFNDSGSSIPALGAPLSGGDGGDAGGLVGVPNIYYVNQVNDDWQAGIAINSPFGLSSEYDAGWQGRYHALKSELLSININPGFSFKLRDDLFVGGGVSAMYLDAELTQAIDFGTIGFSTLGPTTASALGLSPQGNDGFGKVEGDDWAYGVNFGFLYLIDDDTRLGVHYRSRMQAQLKGDASFTVPTAALPLTSTGSFTNTGATADVTLPENVGVGLVHDVNESVSLAFEAGWTRWSRFNELRIVYDSTQPDSVTQEGWDSVWRFAGGINYNVDEDLVLRGGVAWEETPIPSAALRTPRIPDDDRLWLTAGVGYDVTDNITVDVSYAHLFMGDGEIANTSSTGGVLSGDYDLAIDIISLGLTWQLS